MKTTCFALLAMVSLSYCSPQSEKLTFLRPEELREGPVYTKLPQDPAINLFAKLSRIPLLPICVAQGYFRDPYNCGKFYHCNGPDDVPYALYCSPGYIFNTQTSWCDYPEFVDC